AASAAFAKSWRGDELAQRRNENKIAERNYAPNDNQEINDFHRHSGRGESELCREFARLNCKAGWRGPRPSPPFGHSPGCSPRAPGHFFIALRAWASVRTALGFGHDGYRGAAELQSGSAGLGFDQAGNLRIRFPG